MRAFTNFKQFWSSVDPHLSQTSLTNFFKRLFFLFKKATRKDLNAGVQDWQSNLDTGLLSLLMWVKLEFSVTAWTDLHGRATANNQCQSLSTIQSSTSAIATGARESAKRWTRLSVEVRWWYEDDDRIDWETGRTISKKSRLAIKPRTGGVGKWNNTSIFKR